MPFREAIWHLGPQLQPLSQVKLDSEDQLERYLCDDLSLLDPDWMLIGKQVSTGHGRLDLLAVNSDGGLVVIELKKHQTPREVVAQVLDYGSWVTELTLVELEVIFAAFQANHRPNQPIKLLREAFQAHFQGLEFPEEEDINATHELVVVAAELDGQTERILRYLTETWGVPVRAVFFRVYQYGAERFLTRNWLLDEVEEDEAPRPRSTRPSAWEGTYCMTFGSLTDRSWEDARKYKYVSAGGSAWFGPKMKKLRSGDKLLVYIPRKGYVAMAEVEEPAVPLSEFKVPDASGEMVPIRPDHLQNPGPFNFGNDPDKTEYLVRVRWIRDVPEVDAYMEDGLIKGNQNPIYRPGSPLWAQTVAKVMAHWGLS